MRRAAILAQPSRLPRRAAARVDDGARRAAAGHPPRGELGSSAGIGADADDHHIGDGAQPVQMIHAAAAVDVADFPVGVAMRPSSDWPSWAITKGE